MKTEEMEGVKDFEAALSTAISDASIYLGQCGVDFETRHCLWAGQSDDGRKRKAALDKEPFPWEGASDTRIRLADEVINDTVRILRAAMKRFAVQAQGVESNDAKQAAAVTTFLKWLLHSKMSQNTRQEIPLLVNWQEHYAASVLAITWDEETQVEKLPVDLATLQLDMARMAEQPETADAGRLGLEMVGAIFDRTRENDVAEWLQTLFPVLASKPGVARGCVRRLRRTGNCVVPEARVVRSQPIWTACRVMRDVFFPANTYNIQRSPWVAWREPITPEELRSRVLTDDYDEDVVEEAIARCVGTTMLESANIDNERASKAVVDDMDGLLELFHFFRRVVDEDGFMKIEVTDFIPGVVDPLKQADQDYAHKEYPFVDFVRDRVERIIIDNRSVPQIVQTHQDEVKVQRDFRADRASVTIMPPVKVPMNRADMKLNFGPRAIIPERRPGDVSWMNPPTFEMDTVNLEKQVRGDVDNYFARMVDGVSPARQQLYQQSAVDDFLGGLQLAVRQTLSLARQYYSDEFFARITGVQMPFNLSGDEAVGEWDIMLDFNAGDLNYEQVLKKLELINKSILPADTENVIDRVGLAEWAMGSLDPALAARLVQAREPVHNREREDEQMQFAKIFAGIEPEMKPGGQNFALRLQVLENIIRANPQVQQRYAQDEIFRTLLDTRMKHFRFQLQQRENAMVGRLGAMPALGGLAGA